MGFWDFIAPDFDDFKSVVNPLLPPLVQVGAVPVPKDAAIALAWANPGSGVGLALRIYYETQVTQGRPMAQADALNGSVQSQAGTVVNQGSWITQEGQMALVIANTYRVAIEMLAGGRVITNVVGLTGGSAGQEAAAAAAALAAWKVATGPLSTMSSLVTMQAVTAIDLSSATGGISVLSDSTAGGVTSGNTLSTRASSALITWNGSTRSKSARGRLYFGPLRESQIQADGATLEAGAVTALGTAFTAFRNSLSTAGFPLCVISQKNASTTAVTSQAVQTTIATQRRRIRS